MIIIYSNPGSNHSSDNDDDRSWNLYFHSSNFDDGDNVWEHAFGNAIGVHILWICIKFMDKMRTTRSGEIHIRHT